MGKPAIYELTPGFNILSKLVSLAHFQKGEDEISVSTIITRINNNFHWKSNSLSFHLPPQIYLELNTIPLAQHVPQPLDHLSWKLTNNGIFTSKIAYLFISKATSNTTNNSSQSEAQNSNWIWKTTDHPRDQFFLWQAIVKCLPVNIYLHNSNCIRSDLWPLCFSFPESIQHALRDCAQVKNIWNSFYPPQHFFDQSYDDWIKSNVINSTYSILGIPWHLIFLVALREIWLSINKKVFKNYSSNCALLKNHILSRAGEFWYNIDLLQNTSPVTSVSRMDPLVWTKPQEG